ncbi:MAG: GID complex subunit containing RING finger motif [Alyxoria varia]|nr:MAG: GID complex subunit containing RING finger motif [Alyxoria varia]
MSEVPVKLDPTSHLLVDQNLIKVPLELLRKNYKSVQRAFENQREQIQSSLKSASSTSDPVSPIGNAVNRLEILKRKLETLRQDEENLQRQLRTRVQHMQQLYTMHSFSDVKYEEWAKVRLNRLVVDYLLRCGYSNTAKELAEATGVTDMVDIAAYEECHKIETSLENRNTKECLAWCADNKSSLKKIESDLEYELRLQQFIELIRPQDPQKIMEATTHARKYLSQHADPSLPYHASGLLAVGPNSVMEPYCSYFSPDRWRHLSALFLRNYQQLISLPRQSPLHCALSAGLSALKTPSCHSEHPATWGDRPATYGTSVCPICSEELNYLALKVPYAHHSQSNIETDPVMLPNGRVYGMERLLRFQEMRTGDQSGKQFKVSADGELEGWFVDPIDKEAYLGREIQKVFVT